MFRFDLFVFTGRDSVTTAISGTNQIDVYRFRPVFSEDLSVSTAGEVYLAGTARDIFIVFFVVAVSVLVVAVVVVVVAVVVVVVAVVVGLVFAFDRKLPSLHIAE